MDDSDRSESVVPRVAIPAHLVFAFEEWIVEALRQACDDFAKPEARAAVIQAVRLHDRFVAGTLTPAQIAELAARAADWLHPRWPESVEDADEVGRLVGIARQLFELRDCALGVAGDGDDVPRLVSVDAELREVLRSQTLMVLEFGHEPFEQLRDLQPAELLALATTFRDAFAILDVIGWLPTPQTIAVEVEITPSHLAQLEHRRVDLEQSIREQLDDRQGLTDADDITRADEFLQADRLTADALLRILRAGTVEPDAG
jgi:hypothetical protein